MPTISPKQRFRILCVALATLLLAAACSGSGSSAATKPGTTSTPVTTSTPGTSSLVDIGAGIKGPAGLIATIYATGLEHAAAFAFDDRNRLWVATADYSDSGKDAVYLISAAGASPIKVIGTVHTPLGLVWYHGSLYVAAKERIVAYSDLHGSTFTTHRTVISLPSGVGEVNNIVVAPSGRMLVGVSSPCDHCTPTSKYSGAILSFEPGGTDLQVYASGIRAPVGLAYFPNTSDLFVTMNYRDDLGTSTTGDALAVVPSGSAWRNPTCYGQGGTACAGVPDAIAGLDQHAAVSGVAIVTGELGTTVGTSAIVAEWALGKIDRVELTKTGDTYTGATTAFLAGVKNPVALIMAPDDSLFVGDWSTGAIFRIAKVSGAVSAGNAAT